ncbi:MAG: CHAT domain-containing protein, partial [bacterium]|nr:CHAT domain-containing protein [bacterium]
MTTRTTLRLDARRLVWQHGGQPPEERLLADGDAVKLEDWTVRYRHALGRPNHDILQAIGREIFAWLDGDQGWLGRSLPAVTPPWIVEFAAGGHPEDEERQFLAAPWELLADDRGHLAARLEVVYCPCRRFGSAGDPRPPSQYRLAAMFMAAAPEGSKVLSFEAEETAILEATGSIGMDLTVEESGHLPRLVENMARVDGAVDVLHISCHGTSSPEPL